MDKTLEQELVAMNMQSYLKGQQFLLETIIRTLESQLEAVKNGYQRELDNE